MTGDQAERLIAALNRLSAAMERADARELVTLGEAVIAYDLPFSAGTLRSYLSDRGVPYKGATSPSDCRIRRATLERFVATLPKS